jgi:hypothetical protein
MGIRIPPNISVDDFFAARFEKLPASVIAPMD